MNEISTMTDVRKTGKGNGVKRLRKMMGIVLSMTAQKVGSNEAR